MKKNLMLTALICALVSSGLHAIAWPKKLRINTTAIKRVLRKNKRSFMIGSVGVSALVLGYVAYKKSYASKKSTKSKFSNKLNRLRKPNTSSGSPSGSRNKAKKKQTLFQKGLKRFKNAKLTGRNQTPVDPIEVPK